MKFIACLVRFVDVLARGNPGLQVQMYQYVLAPRPNGEKSRFEDTVVRTLKNHRLRLARQHELEADNGVAEIGLEQEEVAENLGGAQNALGEDELGRDYQGAGRLDQE